MKTYEEVEYMNLYILNLGVGWKLSSYLHILGALLRGNGQ
jgi:hypothetical protein